MRLFKEIFEIKYKTSRNTSGTSGCSHFATLPDETVKLGATYQRGGIQFVYREHESERSSSGFESGSSVVLIRNAPSGQNLAENTRNNHRYVDDTLIYSHQKMTLIS